ncbi:MAG TPA: hypothetical protein VGI80_06670, partial [Pyrinomonadaceae bacterium]
MFNFGNHWPKALLNKLEFGRDPEPAKIHPISVPRDATESLIDRLKTVYKEAFRHFEPKRSVPPIHLSFYPYVGINHTIRIRNGEIYVRVGEIC